mmetsp:Transcript_135746/g.307137  ORF Transcript_135746/g.307137 Transcript_135746/m.307137 type:complete len:301 (+) Transcript_135746:19-921(+)
MLSFVRVRVPAGGCAGPLAEAARSVGQLTKGGIRVGKWSGTRAEKTRVPRTPFQIAAEKQFLEMRSKIPDGYVKGFTRDDVKHLSPELQQCLKLQAASSMQISKARIKRLIQKFGRGPTDNSSHPVRIAIMTEKILNQRVRLIQHPKDHTAKITMHARLPNRQKAMKYLYKTDFEMYQWVCKELGIKCVRFPVPGDTWAPRMPNPVAVDGDHARWLIRQRLWRHFHRTKALSDPATGKKVRYNRHPIEDPPATHGMAKPIPEQVSRYWPYGVRQDYIKGQQIVYDPTMAGRGHQPARLCP